MKLDKKYMIEKATSTDETRYALTFVHIDEKAKRLIATTSRILASVPVEIEKDDDVGNLSLTKDILLEARKVSKNESEVNITLNGKFELNNGTRYPRPVESEVGRFPDYEQIIPKQPIIKHSVTLNPALLLDLAKAIGVGKGEGVTLEFQDASGDPAVIVRNGEAFGLIMPMKKPA